MLKSLDNREQPVYPTVIKSIWDPQARQLAAEFAKQGLAVGAFNVTVNAIFGDARHPNFPQEVVRIKSLKGGDRSKKSALALCLPTERLAELVDIEKIPGDLKDMFQSVNELSRLSFFYFLRVPVQQRFVDDGTIPGSAVSYTEDKTPIIQNWDAKGHSPTEDLLRRMNMLGIDFPAVTSLNYTDRGETVTNNEGREIAEESGMPIYLTDPRARPVYHKKIRGSYPIIGVTPSGLQWVRRGNTPDELFPHLLSKKDISVAMTDKTIDRRFPVASLPANLYNELNPDEIRIAVLTFLTSSWKPKPGETLTHAR